MSQGPEYNNEDLANAYADALDQFRDQLNSLKVAALAEISEAARAAEARAQSQAQAAADTVMRQARADLQLQSSQIPLTGTVTLAEILPTGSVLDLPDGLRYLAGSNCLMLYKNGVLQALGIDYIETAGPGISCDCVQLQKAAAVGDVFVFWISPINSASQARQAAAEAAASERQAAEYLESVQVKIDELMASADAINGRMDAAAGQYEIMAHDAATQVGNASTGVDEQVEAARGWAEAAATSAERAYQASVQAYQAVALANNASARPGIRVMPGMADVLDAGDGIYIIDPSASEPSPAMGIYAASSVAEMNFDGFFILTDYSDIPAAAIPGQPLPPGQATPAGQTGAAGAWVPCEHTHGG